MKQHTLEVDDDDSGHSHEEASDNVRGGLHRMISQRMTGESDRKTLLKPADSKRSLLTRGLSRSMVMLKNTVKHKEDEEEEEMVPLMEYEMLKARFHVSEGTVMQQKEEIAQLQMQLNEKDDVIDNLMQRLETMSTANQIIAANAPQRSKGPPRQNKRISSLEEKRQKKRQMELAHSLRLSKSPGSLRNGLQKLESALNFEQAPDEVGNRSLTDLQANMEPISGRGMVRVGSGASLPGLSENNTTVTPEGSPKSPHNRKKPLDKHLVRRSSRRHNAMENLHNSGLTAYSDDSIFLPGTPHQPGKKLAVVEDTSPRPSSPPTKNDSPKSMSQNRRRQLVKQSSKRSSRRKNSMETGNASSNDDSEHVNPSTPRQAEEKEGPNRPKSPHRRQERQLSRQGSRRNNRLKNSTENFHNSVDTTSSGDGSLALSTRQSEDSEYSPPRQAEETKEGPNRSKPPHRRHERQLSRQGSRRNNRLKNSTENFHNSASSGDGSLDLTSTPRQSEKRVHTSRATVEKTKEGRTSSKSPLRRPFTKQSSKRNFNPGQQLGGKVRAPTPPEEPDLTDAPNSPHSRRHVRQAKLGGPSRRRSDDSGSYRNRAQTRSAKAREGLKQNDRSPTGDAKAGPDVLPLASPPASARRTRQAANNKTSSSKQTAALQNTLILPASMGMDFKDQDFYNEPKDNKAEARNETDGFLVNFGESPFTTMGSNNENDQPSRETGHQEFDKVMATQDPPQHTHGATGDNEKQSKDSNDDNLFSSADPIAFSTNFSMMSMDNIEDKQENVVNVSSILNGQKPSQSIVKTDTDQYPTNAGTLSTETEPSDAVSERPFTGSSMPELGAHSGQEGIVTTSERSPSPQGTEGGKDEKKNASRGRNYLLNMNRNETLGDAKEENYSSSRSRSLSPGWTSPRTPSGKRKLRIKKESAKKEPNLDKDALKAKFRETVRKIVKLNDQFQQKALPSLEAEKNVDIRSINTSLSNLDDVLPDVVDESKIDETRISPMAESKSGRIILPPPPPMSAMSPPLTLGRKKKSKTVHWELEKNLFRLLVIPVYDKDQKKDCFYNEEEIKKFRFDLFMEQHATDFDIDSVGDEMMADDILDDMSFADEIVSDEDIRIDMESIRGIESRRGSM